MSSLSASFNESDWGGDTGSVGVLDGPASDELAVATVAGVVVDLVPAVTLPLPLPMPMSPEVAGTVAAAVEEEIRLGRTCTRGCVCIGRLEGPAMGDEAPVDALDACVAGLFADLAICWNQP